jgi:hypothetical protein
MPKNTKNINNIQKGQRRQKLHEAQNNVGNDKNPVEYKSFDGEDLK